MRAGDRADGQELLLGRDDERRKLDDLLALARRGRSGALAIRGEAGIGKTTLLDYACAHADGMRVLRARGVAFESELAFSALYELVRPILGLLDDLPEQQANALRVAFALGGDGSANRLAAYSATLSLVAAAAERGPVLCAVDDAHWIDRASAEALLFAARRLLAEGVAIVFAARDVPGFEAPGVAELTLPGLDEATGIRLATSAGMSRKAAAALVAATAGNPLALVELPASMTEAQRQGRAPLDQPLPVASRVEAAFLTQARTLTDPSWRALLTCAVCETSNEEVLARALDVGGLHLSALDPAVGAGLVTVRAGQVRFRHPLVRSAVYSAAGPGVRRSAHLAVAAAMSTQDDADRRAWHLAAAAIGPDEEVAAALAETAERALRRGGVVAEARAFERSARLTPEPEVRAERLMRAVRAWWKSGAGEHAITLAEEILTLTRRGNLRCAAESARAYMALQRGDLTAVNEAYLAEAESYAAVDPIAAGKMIGVAVNQCWPRLDIPGMLRVCQRMAELTAPNEFDEAWLKGSIELAAAQVLAGLPEGSELARSCVPASLGHVADGTAAELAEVLVWIEEYGAARTLLEPEINEARRLNDVSLQAYALTRLAGLESRVGRLHAAHRAAGEAVQIAEQIGLPSQRAHALAMLAVVEALLGNEADCREHARRARHTSPAGYLDVEARIRYALGICALQAGRYRDAVDELEWIDATVRRVGLVEPNWLPAAGDLAESYLHLSLREPAIAAIEGLEAAGAKTGRIGAPAAAARGRGLLAADADLDDAFKQALALCDAIDAPLERARTLLCYGQRLRRAKRRRDSRQPLYAALALFEAAGAAGWAARCQTEIRATGLRSTRPDNRTGEQLTTQEWQIALNAAEGLTNREIAARVFLSPKTVDYHLGHIYRKLGLRSRHDLIRHLSHTEAAE